MGVQPPEKNRILRQTVQFWTYLRIKAQQVKGAKFAPPCPPPPSRRAGGAIAPAAPVASAPMQLHQFYCIIIEVIHITLV